MSLAGEKIYLLGQTNVKTKIPQLCLSSIMCFIIAVPQIFSFYTFFIVGLSFDGVFFC